MELLVEELTRQLKLERQSSCSLERSQDVWQQEVDTWRRRCLDSETRVQQLQKQSGMLENDIDRANANKTSLQDAHDAVTSQLGEAMLVAQQERLACELAMQQKQQLQNQVAFSCLHMTPVLLFS